MAVVARDTIATKGDKIMVGRDKRGPSGRGPMTGRGLGYCAGNNRSGNETDAEPTGRGGWFGRRFGRGTGQGYGRGEGFGQGYGNITRGPVFEPADGTPQTLANELASLRDQLKALEDRLANSGKES